MRRVRLSIVIVVVSALAHTLIPHSHPWEEDHDHAVPLTAHAQADPTCSLVPLGALEPARPTWCSPTTTGAPTFVQGLNSWLDEWQHGLSNADLGAGYQSFGFGGVAREQHFRHNQHWMVDVDGGGGKGGALMRPDRSFQAENGKLVVETEVAPSIATYGDAGGDVWPEIVVTTAAAPTFSRPNALYAYDEFANHWTFGCRLQRSGQPICAIFDNTAGDAGSGARRYEISWFQPAGTTSFGGYPTPELAPAWKMCTAPDNPDLICRNQYRLELTATSVKLLVNGVRYFEQTGLPPYLQNLVGGQPVYVYMADTVYSMPRVVRFHWDHLAVNPDGVPAGTLPPTSPPAATSTSTPTPVLSTPTPTPTSPAGGAGRSLSLSGAGAFADAPHHPELNVTGDWTVETWFKDETPGGYNHATTYLLMKGDSDVNAEAPFFLRLEWNNLVAGERTGWSDQTVGVNLQASGVSVNAWHHVAATMRASNRRLTLYLDGVQVAQGTLKAQSTTGNTLPVGIGHNGSQHFWRGKVDDVRIWNVARTDAQVQASYRSELSGAQPGLVGNWKLNEGTGTTAADSAGVPQNATLSGGATWSTDVHP